MILQTYTNIINSISISVPLRFRGQTAALLSMNFDMEIPWFLEEGHRLLLTAITNMCSEFYIMLFNNKKQQSLLLYFLLLKIKTFKSRQYNSKDLEITLVQNDVVKLFFKVINFSRFPFIYIEKALNFTMYEIVGNLA